MRVRIVKIGNSQGIRIPRILLEQTGIMKDVELEVKDNQIIIRPLTNPREGWDVAFQSMAQRGDDSISKDFENISNSWDDKKWKW